MPSKRKRDILDGFDPNASDPEDENFNPSEDRPRRNSKKSRPSSRRKRSGPPKRSKYRGSDIEDDDDEGLSDSELEESFGEGGGGGAEEEEDEDDEDPLINATGRRVRKAAAKRQSYKESSEEESMVEDSDIGDELQQSPKGASDHLSRIITFRTDPKNLRSKTKRKPEPPTPTVPTRRSTRARTEDTEEALVELSNSGRHMMPARSSRSRSPETLAAMRATRSTRGNKGVKKPPPPIQEATQETDPKTEPEDGIRDMDELAAPVEEDARMGDDEGQGEGEPVVGDVPETDDAEGEPQRPKPQPQPEGQEEDAAAAADDDDDDVAPITRRTRSTRAAAAEAAAAAEEAEDDITTGGGGPKRRLTRKSRLRKAAQEPSSDFEPGDESGGDESDASHKGANGKDVAENVEESSSPTPRGRRGGAAASKDPAPKRTTRRNQDSGDEEVELDKDEMAEELEELRESSRSRPRRRRQRSPSIQYEQPATKRRRVTKPVDYSIKAIDPAAFEVDDDEVPAAAATPQRGRGGGRNGSNRIWERNFNTTYGPFGGGGGAGSLLGGPWGTGATGGVDSDSSDDEMVQRSGGPGAPAVGMTPTSAAAPVGLFGVASGQAHNEGTGGGAGQGGAAVAAATAGGGGVGGATPNVGKIKSQKAYADADPLGVDLTVDFSKVGGLQGHIDQLKEMVQLPLLYPELFLKFHVTPPRGVLFHGPPGTGKTLLARALANSVGAGGRKIAFYMRKGADALSKWVGEAEKQLRLLFEEARRNQPSIIFFDEIDGLAPVRSSKQEQIHASIVSTLLALMDGMDGRGQVIVIGATNRPDNIDPALRRPGRFDREFYFPLPDRDGRRSIVDIHTRDWGLSEPFKTALAERTKGYGGADLRALCTEAALNAIQRTYPQIYSSREKLVVDPDRIAIHATDFLLSIDRLVPSSERSAASSAQPLPPAVEPLLRSQFRAIVRALDDVLPRKKKTTALEEAMYEQPGGDGDENDRGFGREALSHELERSRIFRPRMLIAGRPGMGQNYLSTAILHHLEGVHVQNFDMATVLGDGRPLEQVIVSLFTEVKRHKPSVIYIPAIDSWWAALHGSATATFCAMLRSIPPSDPVLLLGTAECEVHELDGAILRELFGFSKKNRAVIDRPNKDVRVEYFTNVINHLRKAPTDFPDPADRKRRVLEELPVAPPPPPKTLTRAEAKAQRKADLHSLNILKTRLQPIMDQIHRRYRKFRQPVIPLAHITYLFDESDPNYVRPDLTAAAGGDGSGHVDDDGAVPRRPYEIAKDREGTDGLRDTATGKFFYNLETTTIEERLANGYYARPRDFYADINKLYNDAKNIGDRERALKANELRTNVEVDVTDIEQQLTSLGIRFEEVHQRQLARSRELLERARKRSALQSVVDSAQTGGTGGNNDNDDSDSQGPVGVAIAPGYPLSSSTTGARFQVMMGPEHGGTTNTNTTSNESRLLTNGNSVPSREDGQDTQMSGMDDETQPMSGPFDPMGPPPPLSAPSRGGGGGGGSSRQTADSARATAGHNTQVSQVSAMTSVPPGMSPSALVNNASTTGTSDPSTNRAGSGQWSTQATNGISGSHSHSHHGGSSSNGSHNMPQEDTSQLPDTQPQTGTDTGRSQATTDELWPHSQAQGLQQQQQRQQQQQQESMRPPPPGSRVGSVANLLNDEPGSGGGSNGNNSSHHHHQNSSVGSSQQPVVDEKSVGDFLETIASQTSGCTIEQLEQIHRELMDEIWRTRGEWNRMKVHSALLRVFNDTIADIEMLQGLMPSSQEVDPDGARGDEDMCVYLR